MKLVEALKNLKTIEKRVDKNCEQIQQYASAVSTETLPFETEERQRQEVSSLIQANHDLEKEYLKLKTAIEHTNLSTKVHIGERMHTISELITIKGAAKGKPGIGRFRLKTHQALTPAPAMSRMQQLFNKQGGIDAQNPPKVIPFYKEEDKNRQLKDWEEFMSQIDGKLEVVNAETELQHYNPPVQSPAAEAA
jgi:hypothetical protein